MPDTSTVAAAGTVLTVTSGAAGVFASWWDSLPSGVALSLTGIVAGLAISALFRWIADRRDRLHKARIEDYRRIEHEAKMRLYAGGADSDVAPL